MDMWQTWREGIENPGKTFQESEATVELVLLIEETPEESVSNRLDSPVGMHDALRAARTAVWAKDQLRRVVKMAQEREGCEWMTQELERIVNALQELPEMAIKGEAAK